MRMNLRRSLNSRQLVAPASSQQLYKSFSYFAMRIVAATVANCCFFWFDTLANLATGAVSATGAVRVGAFFLIHSILRCCL
jgi:hypothetical protein